MTRLWSVDCAAVSHPGLVRRVNEDAWLAKPEIGIFAVADGMGGHARGHVASKMVIDALAGLPPAPNARTMRRSVETALAGVNQGLAAGARLSGSTVVVLLLCGRHFAVLWAGDSRAYRAGPGGFMQVTRDHSRVQELLDRGALTPEAARGSSIANEITRAVGAAPELQLEGTQGKLCPGDIFLLCSDGLTRHVEDPEIQSTLERLSAGAAGDALLQLTLARGASDNVTAVLVRLWPQDSTRTRAHGQPVRRAPA